MVDSANIYNSSEIFDDAEIKEERPHVFNKKECIFSFIVLLLSFGFMRFVLWNTTGFITTAFYIAITTAVIIFMKSQKYKFSKLNILIAAVLYAFSFVFSITDNNFIKFLDIVFLFGGGAYFIYSTGADNKKIEKYFPFAMIKAIFEYPIQHISCEILAMKSVTKHSKFGKNLKMILIGLFATIPLTVIVAALLMSADDGVEKMLTGTLSFFFSGNLYSVILQLLLAIPCACYLYGMIYANTNREYINVLSDEKCEEKLEKARRVQNLIIYTAVAPICVLYALFFISQANYFLSAFAGNLPSGYSYADYARRGFFELFTITIINLAVIIVISLIAGKSGKNKPVMLKVCNIMLCVFTLFMIATAVSKMVMYISAYGLTQLRVYTTWFMLLCAIFFIMIIIKQIKFDFNFAKFGIGAFIAMFAILCFSRPDALIAKYNIEMYRSGSLNELDKSAIIAMSDDAVLEALQYGELTEEEVSVFFDNKRWNTAYDRYNISSFILEKNLNLNYRKM